MKDKCKSGTGIIIYLRIGMGNGCDQRGRRRYQIKLHLYLENMLCPQYTTLYPNIELS